MSARSIALGLVLAAAASAGCGRVEAEVRSTKGATNAGALACLPFNVPAEELGFWWAEVGEQSVATAWFSPLFRDENGEELRVWTLVCSLPGSPKSPLSGLQGVVLADDDSSIMLDRVIYRVELKPRPGKTWRTVARMEDVDATTEGFY